MAAFFMSAPAGAAPPSPIVDDADDPFAIVDAVPAPPCDVVLAYIIAHSAQPWSAKFKLASTTGDPRVDVELDIVVNGDELNKYQLFEMLGSGGRFEWSWSCSYFKLVTTGGLLDGSFKVDHQRVRKMFTDFPCGGSFSFWMGKPGEDEMREFLKTPGVASRDCLCSWALVEVGTRSAPSCGS